MMGGTTYEFIEGILDIINSKTRPIFLLFALILLGLYFIVGIIFFKEFLVFGGIGALMMWYATKIESKTDRVWFAWVGVGLVLIGAATTFVPPSQYPIAYAIGGFIFGLVLTYKIDMIDGVPDLKPWVYFIIGLVAGVVVFFLVTKEYTTSEYAFTTIGSYTGTYYSNTMKGYEIISKWIESLPRFSIINLIR